MSPPNRQDVSLGDHAGLMPSDDLLVTLRLIGIVTTAQLRASGVSPQQIETYVRRRSLFRVGRGVYARSEVSSDHLVRDGGDVIVRAAAALAMAGPGAAVGHQTAARLFGIDLLGKPENDVTLICPPEHGWRSRAGTHVYATALPPEHLTTAFGLPCTTAARTVVDLARTVDFRAGVVAADSALHRKLTTKPEIEAVIAALPRRRGIVRAAEVIAFADELAESVLESIARVVFRDIGLPAPELQAWLGRPKPFARVDFYWKKYRTIGEVDGAIKYDDRQSALTQLRRDALLRGHGYEVVHFTWHDINDRPMEVRRLLIEAFERGKRAPRRAPSR